MKRTIVPVLLVGLLAAGGVYLARSAARSAEYAPTGPGNVYVALGDSLAAGFVVGAPEEAYVARIAATIRAEQPIDVRNFAVPGETSSSLLRRQLPAALAYIEEQRAAGRRVSPITIDIGGNDLLRARPLDADARHELIAAVERNIGDTLDQLRDATSSMLGGREADLAIMTYYNPFLGDSADPASDAYWSTQLNLAIQRAARARGVAVADVASAFAGGNVYRYTYITSGDIHANADGHGLIAERFLEALEY
jgi:lysophospholipase L1-like esterase